MTNNIKVEDLTPVKSMPLIDVRKYEGKRAKIAIVEVVDDTTNYNKEGKWVEGLNRPVKKLRVATEILEVIKRDDSPDIELRAEKKFSLKQRKDGSWGWPDNEKSNLYKFMRRQKVSLPIELKGTDVLLTTTPSKNPDDDREWLDFLV
ncbi:MAG: hypothetical protein AABY22_09920 [Nanoarchaeota archaeon]